MTMVKFYMMEHVDKLFIRLINEGYADADILKMVDEPEYNITEVREYLCQKNLMKQTARANKISG